MSGNVPSFIHEGGKVLYKGRVKTVVRYFFTCPCAVGDTTHHPESDVLMLVFRYGEKVPYDFRTVKRYKGK